MLARHAAQGSVAVVPAWCWSRTVHECAWPAELGETTRQIGLARRLGRGRCGLAPLRKPHIVGGCDGCLRCVDSTNNSLMRSTDSSKRYHCFRMNNLRCDSGTSGQLCLYLDPSRHVDCQGPDDPAHALAWLWRSVARALKPRNSPYWGERRDPWHRSSLRTHL